eukprot:COSAG02_NODE_2606_length_8439_cov_10.095204_2_plen_163_part_00
MLVSPSRPHQADTSSRKSHQNWTPHRCHGGGQQGYYVHRQGYCVHQSSRIAVLWHKIASTLPLVMKFKPQNDIKIIAAHINKLARNVKPVARAAANCQRTSFPRHIFRRRKQQFNYAKRGKTQKKSKREAMMGISENSVSEDGMTGRVHLVALEILQVDSQL